MFSFCSTSRRRPISGTVLSEPPRGTPRTRFAAWDALDVGNGTMQMAAVTYHVVLAFMRSEDGDIVATEPKEARSADQAIRMAQSLAATEPHCGAIAFSRTGDPAVGDFEDALILKAIGEVDEGLLRPTV